MSVSHRRGARSRYIVASWLRTELLLCHAESVQEALVGIACEGAEKFLNERKNIFMKAWGEKGRRDFPERKKSLTGGHGSWIMTKGDFFSGEKTFVKIFINKFFRFHIHFFKIFYKNIFFLHFFRKNAKNRKIDFFQKKKGNMGI